MQAVADKVKIGLDTLIREDVKKDPQIMKPSELCAAQGETALRNVAKS